MVHQRPLQLHLTAVVETGTAALPECPATLGCYSSSLGSGAGGYVGYGADTYSGGPSPFSRGGSFKGHSPSPYSSSASAGYAGPSSSYMPPTSSLYGSSSSTTYGPGGIPKSILSRPTAPTVPHLLARHLISLASIKRDRRLPRPHSQGLMFLVEADLLVKAL